MSHDHDHHHDELALRAAALEAVLVERASSTDQIDAIVERYERDLGPQNGARVVARAWVDREYRERLRSDGAAAIRELGYGGFEGDTMVVVENTPEVHNVVVCTLCSCYPWPVLGLPPDLVQEPGVSRPCRRGAAGGASRVRRRAAARGRDPRVGLDERGALPRPARAAVRHRRMSEEELAGLVTRDSMIGTGLAASPA